MTVLAILPQMFDMMLMQCDSDLHPNEAYRRFPRGIEFFLSKSHANLNGNSLKKLLLHHDLADCWVLSMIILRFCPRCIASPLLRH